MTNSILATLLILATSLREGTNAQTSCSCAPRSFDVTLDLSNTCDDNTISSNVGISQTDCTIESGDDFAFLAKADGSSSVDDIIATVPWIKDIKRAAKIQARAKIEAKQNKKRPPQRNLQGDSVPVIITSVQFIEIDAAGELLSNSQACNVNSCIDGSTFSISSVTSQLEPGVPIEDQPGRVPETAVLFMIGLNDQNEEVRGRFVWRYTNSCAQDATTIEDGDLIGFPVFDNVENQVAEFCPTNEQTPSPTPGLETPIPTTNPTLDPVTPTPTIDDNETILPSFSPTGRSEPETASPTASPTANSFTPFPTPTGDVGTPTTEQPIAPFPTFPTDSTSSPTVESGPVVTKRPTRRPTGMSLPENAYLEQFHFVNRPIGKSGKTKGAKHMGKGKGGKGQEQLGHHKPPRPQHRPTHTKSSKKFHGWRPTHHRPQASWMGKSGKGHAWWRPPPSNIVWWGHAKAGKRTRAFSDEGGVPTGV